MLVLLARLTCRYSLCSSDRHGWCEDVLRGERLSNIAVKWHFAKNAPLRSIPDRFLPLFGPSDGSDWKNFHIGCSVRNCLEFWMCCDH